jgi:hypothetical protein
MPEGAAPDAALRFDRHRGLTPVIGVILALALDVDEIAAFRTSRDSFDLRTPRRVRRRRIISTIARRLDDPSAFHAAIARLEATHGDRGI